MCAGPFGPAGARSALVIFCSYELTEDFPWLWMYVLLGSGGRRVRVAGRGFVGRGCLLFGFSRRFICRILSQATSDALGRIDA